MIGIQSVVSHFGELCYQVGVLIAKSKPNWGKRQSKDSRDRLNLL
ncbi:hypothetical protein [Leptolyngbya sp. NK1-12]|nr:hypothetical protein [Leptolyngbya sp. NK1-12]